MYRSTAAITHCRTLTFIGVVWLWTASALQAEDAKPADKQPAKKITYAEHVQPIFRAK